MHWICSDGSHLQKPTLFRGLSIKKSPNPTVPLIIKHLLSLSRGGPPRGHLPCADDMKELGCSARSKDGFRQPYNSSQYFTGKFLMDKVRLFVQQWWQDKRQWSNWNKNSSHGIQRKPPYSLQGHPSSRAGCPEWSSFHPWMFSSPSWIKPWATFSDTTTSHDLSRRLGWRLPTDQRLQLSDLEIIPATVKMKANFAMFGSNYKLCCEA